MNFYEGKKVLIPGAAGLSGQALVRKLVPLGADVTATEWKHRRIDEKYRSAVKIYSGLNLLTASKDELADLYAGQDVVFWCGAIVGGAKHISVAENVDEMIHTNLHMAMRNVLAAVKAKVGRLCYISSSYVYADNDIPSIEDRVGDYMADSPLEIYGLSWIKRYMETVCRHHHMTSSTKFALVRPTAYYGPHDDFNLDTCHALPAFIRRFTEAKDFIELWGSGQERRQCTYVDDLVDGLMRVTEDYCVCDPVNIASGEISTIMDVAQGVAKLTQKYNWGFSHSGPTAIKDRLVDVSKAKRLLGFECKTSLADGLRKTLDWYLANKPE